MRVANALWWMAMAVVAIGAARAEARTACTDDATAACVDLAGHVGQYDRLLWAVCAADSPTVCKCWNAQQRESGVDWCQWAGCACENLKDATLKQGVCGLSTACGTLATLKQRGEQLAAQSAPARLSAQVDQVRAGEVVDCTPEACMAYGPACARAAGALEILKDSGKLADGTACAQLAKDPAAFAAQVHTDGISPAVAACACAAVF